MVVISPAHLIISDKLAEEMNRLAKRFDIRSYSKIGQIDSMLLKRDISIEKKKKLLIESLHALVAKTFAINRKKFTKSAFNALASRLLGIRKIVLKLRSINHYLETMFLEDLSLLKMKIPAQNGRLSSKKGLIRDELEALEYTAYRLIGEVVVLDRRLLAEYSDRGKRMLTKEKIEVKDLGLVLGKQSEALEHLEAKLPPPRQLPAALVKEPLFTHWVARVLALLSYIEHLHKTETKIFDKLKRNKSAKARISKKIVHLARERSKLLDIMEEKAISMKKRGLDGELRKELRNFTATIML